VRRPESLDEQMDYRGMGVLLALAHEFDMPALTLHIKRMLLPPAGHLEVCLADSVARLAVVGCPPVCLAAAVSICRPRVLA